MQNLQHAIAVDVLAALGVAFQDRKDNVLLARAGEVVQADAGRDVDQFLRRFALEIGKIHGLTTRGIAVRLVPIAAASAQAGARR